MDTQTQIERLIELAIVQRTELKQLVEQLPQLREHLNAEVERTFEEAEPQIRTELEEFVTRQAADKAATLGTSLEAKIGELAKSLEESAQAKYSALIATRDQNATLLAQAEERIAAAAGELPAKVKDIVAAELARFPRAGEIDQLRKEFAEPRGLNPRGKWQAGENYNKLDLVTINGDSYTSNTDNNITRPTRSSSDWTLVAARGAGGGGGPTSLSELTTVPSNGDILIGSGTSWVTSNLTAGAGISITVGAGEITISATDGDITLDDGTAASPSLHFTNDADTGLYRPAANTLGISVSGTQVAYFDENGLTVPSAGVVAGGSIHAGNGNANNPSLSFDGDQDTGFFRHQPNEIGIALGGTQYATLTSTTFSITPVVTMASSLRVNGTTDSSSKDTGAIITEGGLGVEKSASIGGNLTVSGGTITGGTSGMSLASGGTNQNVTLVPSGNGLVSITGGTGTQTVGFNKSGGNNFYLSVVSSADESLRFQNSGGTNLVEFNKNGNVLVGTTTDNSATFASARTGVAPASSGSTSTAAIRAVDVSNDLALDIGVNSSASPYPGWIQVHGRTNQATNYPLSLNPNGGVVLVNTSANSGNGAIQLATHTTSAGGIGFGTDTSLYRGLSGIGTLELSASSGTVSIYKVSLAGTAKAQFGIAAGATYIDYDGSLLVRNGIGGTTALTLDSSQNATFAGKITANGAGSTFKGTATNDNAAAGYVGEFVSSAVVSASAVSLTNATAANITSISLTAGDWDVTGLVQYNFTGATCSFVYHGFSSASASFGAPNSYVQDYRNYTTASVSTHNPSLTFRISLAATTTIYFVTQADFSAGTVAAYGRIQARRVR